MERNSRDPQNDKGQQKVWERVGDIYKKVIWQKLVTKHTR